MLTAAELSDRQQIRDLLSKYTRAIDRGEWALLDEVFTPDARIDYTSAGGIAGSRAEVTAWLAEVLPHFTRRIHMLGQFEFAIDGDAAAVSVYFLNPMVITKEDGTEMLWECGGYYHHKLVRTPAGWCSRELVEETVWTR